MFPLSEFLSKQLIEALGWTVLHSLWQGLLLALMVAFAGWAWRRKPAQWRYLLANGALGLMLVFSAVTFFSLYRLAPEGADGVVRVIVLETAAPMVSPEAEPPAEGLLVAWMQYFQGHLPLVVTMWLLGAMVFALRFLGGFLYVQQLRHRNVYPAPGRWQGWVGELARSLGVSRPVRLLESGQVAVPMVIGIFKPVILMPVGALHGLTPRQVEAVLAHEMAHIARADYLFNLLQSLVEVMFYFNPAVWWISSQARQERENCCDDMAVAYCGDKLDYVKALLELQELGAQGPQLAMTFTGNRHHLLYRVRRLLQPTAVPATALHLRFVAICFVLCLLLVLSAGLGDPAIAHTIYLTPDEPAARLAPMPPLPDLPRAMELPPVAPVLDTIPQGRSRLEIVRGDDSRVEVVTEEGQIRSLRLDGRDVPADSLAEYRPMVEEMYERLEKPSDEERIFGIPAPRPRIYTLDRSRLAPAPLVFGGGKMIQTEKDEEGNTVVRIEGPDGEMTEVVVGQQDGEPVIVLDGRVIDPEESTIILENAPTFQFDFIDSLDLEGLRFKAEDMARGIRIKARDFQLRADSLLWRNEMFPEGDWEWIDTVFSEGRWLDSLEFKGDWMEDFQLELENMVDGMQGMRFLSDANTNVWNDEVRAAFEAALREDGILPAGESSYRLEFSRRSFKVNGEEQAPEVRERFVELYEEITGSLLHPSTRFVITHD